MKTMSLFSTSHVLLRHHQFQCSEGSSLLPLSLQRISFSHPISSWRLKFHAPNCLFQSNRMATRSHCNSHKNPINKENCYSPPLNRSSNFSTTGTLASCSLRYLSSSIPVW